MATGKSSGPDGVPPEATIVLMKERPTVIAKLIDRVFHEGIFPDQWKAAKLALIPCASYLPGLSDSSKLISHGSSQNNPVAH